MDARHRIVRASRDIEQVIAALTAWEQAGDAYRLITEPPDSALAINDYSVEIVQPISDELRLQATDVVTNLRFSLDYLAWHMYLQSGGDEHAKHRRSVQFPIVTDKANWAQAVARHLPGVTGSIVDRLKELQPAFRDEQTDVGTHALAAVQELSNIGKHRTLNLVGAAVQDSTIHQAVPPPDTLVGDGLGWQVTGKADISRAGFYPIFRVATLSGPEGVAQPVPRDRAWRFAGPQLEMVFRLTADEGDYDVRLLSQAVEEARRAVVIVEDCFH